MCAFSISFVLSSTQFSFFLLIPGITFNLSSFIFSVSHPLQRYRCSLTLWASDDVFIDSLYVHHFVVLLYISLSFCKLFCFVNCISLQIKFFHVASLAVLIFKLTRIGHCTHMFLISIWYFSCNLIQRFQYLSKMLGTSLHPILVLWHPNYICLFSGPCLAQPPPLHHWKPLCWYTTHYFHCPLQHPFLSRYFLTSLSNSLPVAMFPL